MRLKQVELQGYKSFALRTQFAFDGGITAIVGPNGSGKSNVADAIRWVLGEQSYRTLRGKRSEDMIFAGSTHRSRLGMASVSLTLDNADAWLPIDFAEVVITRRAFRSGENEYLLNGQRVRLRDITELLARSGLAQRTYAVVGQGLVDAVLSLRPDDRRSLFEEAAGIAHYREKRADALARIEETRANLLRVNDIVHEIAPRLQRLEREAERADRHAMLQRQLEGLLRTWYGFRWRQAHLGLRRSRDAVVRRELWLQRRRNLVTGLLEKIAALRDRQSRLRDTLGTWHRESAELHLKLEDNHRELAVWQERERLLSRQHGELETELVQLGIQEQAAADLVVTAQGEIAIDRVRLAEKEAFVVQLQAQVDAVEEQRTELRGQVARRQTALLGHATDIASRRSRLAQLGERAPAALEEKTGYEQAISVLQARQNELRGQLAVLEAEKVRLDREGSDLSARHQALQLQMEEAQSRQTQARDALLGGQRAVERIRERYDLMSRLREEGEGLYAGVRAVVRAIDRLSGILGTVAQLVQVPAEYEVAMEVALSGHLQDLVVGSWSDAERAIAFLREGSRGRATFLPLDTIRIPQRIEVSEANILGVAADLVRVEDRRLTPVVELLLGRTVVARDLSSARRTFDRLRGGFQIVTLSGDVLRSSGSVTGGHAAERQSPGDDSARRIPPRDPGGPGGRQSGPEAAGRRTATFGTGQVLSREREWREMPGVLRTAEERLKRAEIDHGDAVTAVAQIKDETASVGALLSASQRASAQLAGQRRELERQQEQASQQIDWRQGLLDRLETERIQADQQVAALSAELDRLAALEKAAQDDLAALHEQSDALHLDALHKQLSEAQAATALVHAGLGHKESALRALLENRRRLGEQVASKRSRLDLLQAERTSLARQAAEGSRRESDIRERLAALALVIEPADAELSALEAEREQLAGEEAAGRDQLHEAESRHAQAVLSKSRHEDRVRRLRRQIVDDFGIVAMEPQDGAAEQLPLPLAELVSRLPDVETLPGGLEEDIQHIRSLMRRMGSVNPGASQEYAEVLQRHTFLTAQMADLEEAARQLKEVIENLDEVMRSSFGATFEAVSARFRDNFSRLFGGGAARVLLSDPEDLGSTGVEVLASPPGKRLQSMALLSGGERALTAAALIFALLQVSPPPFCVLDEVDAMLDESNVMRFRQLLEDLSRETQFIVITHNRATVEAASTVYGISMGEDSVSQVVSLRLEDRN